MNNYYFLGFAAPNFNPLKFDFDGAAKWEDREKFMMNFLVGTQFMDGLILLISIVQIRCIIKKVGVNNKMVNQTGFLIHGILFVLYMVSTLYWAYWNRKTTEKLDSLGNNINPIHFITHIKELKAEYQAWLKTYYICLMQFTFSNLCVQTFTVYIFYSLTKKETVRQIDKVDASSLIEVEDVTRIDYLEGDHNHIQT